MTLKYQVYVTSTYGTLGWFGYCVGDTGCWSMVL